ncbi:MAG: DUF1186 domain-containing protein [Thalassotalea sp.]
MNLEQILFSIVDINDNEIPVAGLAAAKENWSIFYPELEKIMAEFIADHTSVTEERQTILFYGTFLCAELKYKPALPKCLQLFSQTDSYFSPLEAVFGATLTELISTLFYNIGQGETQTLSDYVIDDHEAMYCKAAAIEAVFAQFEMEEIELAVLEKHITRWFDAFVTSTHANNPFLLSVIASNCIDYQLDQFQAAFISLESKERFDEEYLSMADLIAWDSKTAYKLIAQDLIQPAFNVVDTFTSWDATEHNDFPNAFVNDNAEENMEGNVEADEFDNTIAELMADNGMFANMLFDEKTIIENSVPVSELIKVGRNDPCHCGSGKKYKKCCLN